MHRKLLSLIVLSILVASTVLGCVSSQPCSLTMFSVTGGNVAIMKADTASWIEAEAGMSLEPGDVIECGDNSTAELTFVDGTIIDLQAGTEIEVDSLVCTDTGSATIVLKQTIGSILFRVIKLVDPGSHYEVETPTGAVAIRGSAVQITVSQDGTTWACNLEGDIWATAQGVELQVPEAQCCVIRPGQPPLTAQASGAYISLNPRSGLPGEQLEVEGYGFVAGESIRILFDGQLLVGSIWTDKRGHWRVSLYVPAMPPGKHVVTAEGEYTKVQDIFEIEP